MNHLSRLNHAERGKQFKPLFSPDFLPELIGRRVGTFNLLRHNYCLKNKNGFLLKSTAGLTIIYMEKDCLQEVENETI